MRNHEDELKNLKHIKVHALGEKFTQFSHNHVFVFFACLVWLLIRSLRRPSRLAYPCQRAAALTVIAYLGLIIYLAKRHLISFFKEKSLMGIRSRYILISFISLSLLSFTVQRYMIYRSWEDYRITKKAMPVGILTGKLDKTNKPIYKTIPAAAAVIGPHRVISVHDSDATSWTGTGVAHYYLNQSKINEMTRDGILLLTGETDYVNAWKTLIPYSTGDVVAIKVNCNNGCDLNTGRMDPYAELINAAIDGLIGMGVPANKIWLVDPSRNMENNWKARITNQSVTFNPFKEQYVSPTSPYTSLVHFYAEGNVVVRPAEALVQATHIINMPQLKGHGGASVTLSLKNHWGSAILGTGSDPQASREAWHKYLYQGMPEYAQNRNNGGSSPLVGIGLNPIILYKTRLIIGDGLFGNATLNYVQPEVFKSFGNQPPETLFFGVDPVAVDSVMFDYLQRECSQRGLAARNDDLLVEAGSYGYGVHEHWDGDSTRKYSAIDYVEVDLDTSVMYGDVSGDGEITAYDAALTAQASVGIITLTEEQTEKADVSGEGEITAYDAALIAQYSVGIITKFPVEG